MQSDIIINNLRFAHHLPYRSPRIVNIHLERLLQCFQRANDIQKRSKAKEFRSSQIKRVPLAFRVTNNIYELSYKVTEPPFMHGLQHQRKHAWETVLRCIRKI
ncbi:hypothetical protein FGO68_gene3856 [Halteria grandinella]|uniref:Uncharacterized protein n=1 Tax=Halteria grandinella TaxID=5974 RepID=A0A8J8T9U3_HALGN|nr:hypothetical protein FGO68_gene3856 [Halteria grandinella]